MLLKPSHYVFFTSVFICFNPCSTCNTRCLLSPSGFKETAFLYAISSAGLTHAMAKACSAGRMERCTCDEAPDLENREAWQWGGCGDNLKYSNKFVKEFLGRKPNKDLRARVDFHNNLVGMKVSGGWVRGLQRGELGVSWWWSGFVREINKVVREIRCCSAWKWDAKCVESSLFFFFFFPGGVNSY